MSFIPEVSMKVEPEPEPAFDRAVVEESVEVEDGATEEPIDVMVCAIKEEPEEIDNIFEDPPSPKPLAGAQKLNKNGRPRKKRKPLTEENLAKLAKARAKATEARLRKSAERKADLQLAKDEKDLLKKQRVKRVNQLKEEVGEDPDSGATQRKEEPKPAPPSDPEGAKQTPAPPKSNAYSQSDLDDAVLNGIMKYETIRKQRKETKKVDAAAAAEKEAIKAQLRAAVAPPRSSNPYSQCY